MIKKYTDKFFCFSPPVMIATFVVEVILAIYVLWRYKLTAVSRLAVLILVFLAIFQLAEFMICGGFGLDGMAWSRLGYVAITLLPPLGIHLAHVIAKKSPSVILWLAYASALAFGVFFVFATQSITGQVCQGNYVIFEVTPGSVVLFTLYYYGWLLANVWLCFTWAKQVAKKQAKSLCALAIGYIAFIAPTTTVNVINPETLNGVPSIMCGFAVLLAVTLVFWVVPAVVKPVR